MHTSETAAARNWVVGLQPGTWFWNREVPARPNIARTVLHQLKNDPKHGIWRVAQGLYWRGWPEDHAYHVRGPNTQIGALIYAGSGAGLYGWSALNRLEWTLQCPVKDHVVATVNGRKRCPESFHATVVYHCNRNQRRLELTWAEVTVLEAVPMLRYTEEPWHECLDRLVTGASAAKLGWGAPYIKLRSAALTWAVETEAEVNADTLHRVGQIASALGRVSRDRDLVVR